MRLHAHIATAAAAGALLLSGCDATAPAAPEADPLVPLNGEVIEGRYIVVMKDAPGEGSRVAINRLIEEAEVGTPLVFDNALAGFAGEIGASELEMLRNDERVAYIEPDRMMVLKKPSRPGNGGGGPAQSTPYGIDRVNGGVASNGRACVIDSGIDLDHPDLNVDRNASRTFITSGRDSRSADDRNGHGTHVAGTIAAIDNATGVVGVAAGATVVAVKVLDASGSGSYSGVIAGVDYVASGAPNCAVANMSLGGSPSQAVDDAVLSAGRQGVTMVLAAGNESRDAQNSSPARAGGASANDNVYTISAIDSNDRFASFSNYGADVEYAAPGVAIYSTYLSGGYATLSGTSMAAPHAAGVFLLGNARTDGFAQNDPDGNADPIIVN